MRIQYRTFRNFVRAAAICFLALGSGQAFATCAQGNLTGVWYFGGVNIDTSGLSGANFGYYCKVQINAGGAVAGGSSSCRVSEDDSRFPANITNGEITVDQNCAASGFFRVCFEPDQCARLNINGAKLTGNKQVLLWTGRQGSEINNFQYFTGIKEVL